MAIGRQILSGLFGATAGGFGGFAQQKAEERARMERQQETQSQREFELEMMRERQAAQRAAARRSTLAAKLEREGTERFRTAQLGQQAEEARLTAEFRAAETERAREEAAALERYREEERFDRQFGDLASAWSNYVKDQGNLNLPVDEQKTIEFVSRFAAQRNIPQERVAEMVGRLSATLPTATTPAPVAEERIASSYRKKYAPETPSLEFTEEELGDELNQLYEAQKLFEDEFGVRKVANQAFLGYEAGARARGPGPLPETIIRGGTREQRKDYENLLKRIDEVTGLLTSGQFR